MESSVSRLKEFIQSHILGECKIISQGRNCKCPLCDLDRICDELSWYGGEAMAIQRHLQIKNTDAVMAVVTVLSLDAGKRAEELLKGKEGI